MKVLENHLWYLSDELVGLALFDNRLPSSDKLKICNGLTKEPSERKVRGNATLLEESASLGSLASSRTMRLLPQFEINYVFFALPPEEWENNESYRQGQDRLKKLCVVNDTAERGVIIKLFQAYNTMLTNDEEEKQIVLQVVEAHRKLVPHTNHQEDCS